MQGVGGSNPLPLNTLNDCKAGNYNPGFFVPCCETARGDTKSDTKGATKPAAGLLVLRAFPELRYLSPYIPTLAVAA